MIYISMLPGIRLPWYKYGWARRICTVIGKINTAVNPAFVARLLFSLACVHLKLDWFLVNVTQRVVRKSNIFSFRAFLFLFFYYAGSLRR